MPITRSRGVPKRRRRGPEEFDATMPPMVARSEKGGSSGIICRLGASTRLSSAYVIPASTLMVRPRDGPGACTFGEVATQLDGLTQRGRLGQSECEGFGRFRVGCPGLGCFG